MILVASRSNNFVQDTLYIMMLGDYDRDDFPDTYTSLMSFLFMFLVVVIMMNVLIAIVSDSYDNAMVRSNELYSRARLELVAEVSTTFKKVLEVLFSVDNWEKFLKNRGQRVGNLLTWFMGFETNTDDCERITVTLAGRVYRVLLIPFLPVVIVLWLVDF